MTNAEIEIRMSDLKKECTANRKSLSLVLDTLEKQLEINRSLRQEVDMIELYIETKDI